MAYTIAYVVFFVYLCPRKGFFRPVKQSHMDGHNPGKVI